MPVDCWSGGAKEHGPEELRSHDLWRSVSVGLLGKAWHAMPAVLLVNHGMEKPSTS
jgi:hypothetical protein